MIVILLLFLYFFFFNDTATTEIYTLSLHDALPIYFEEVELSVIRAAYELGMRRAARESECGEQFTVQARQPLVLARVVLDCVRGEDAALLRHAQRGPTVLARPREDDVAPLADRGTVED